MEIATFYDLSMDGKLDFLSKGDLKYYSVPFSCILFVFCI